MKRKSSYSRCLNRPEADRKKKQRSSSAQTTTKAAEKTSMSKVSSILQKKCPPLAMDMTSDSISFLTDYRQLSNETLKLIFVEILKNIEVPDDDARSWMTMIDDEHILCYLRQWIHLKNHFVYCQLQEQQWSSYQQLGRTKAIWHGRVSRKMAQDHAICQTYGRQKTIVEQRLTKYQKDIVRIQKEIDEHQSASPQPWISSDRISRLIDDFIDGDQSVLRIELERRRTMLDYDAHDHQLLREFYQLKPRKTEVD